MSIPRVAVDNPVAANLLMLIIIAMGLVQYARLDRSLFPEVEPESIAVTTAYPGAAPEEIEKSITVRIEEGIETIDGVDEIRSSVREGSSAIVVELATGVDRDRVMVDLQQKIDQLEALPEEAEASLLTEMEMRIPVIAVVLYGDVPERRLRRAILEIRDELVRDDAISRVIVTGAREPEISIEVRRGALERFGLSFEDIATAVRRSNLDLAAGLLRTTRGDTRLRTVGEESVARRLEDLVVTADAAGRAVLLREVARVRETFEEQVDEGRFAGQRAMSAIVFMNDGEDALSISARVKRLVAERDARLAGSGLSIETTTDLARFIEQRLDLMTRNATVGLVLVFIALALFLRLAVAFWAASGLVVSLLGTFVILELLDQTINLISLFALIVVLGLIVDDAIVVGENIYRRMEQGEDPKRAAIRGTVEMQGPVLAAVLTTAAAFAPLAFIESRLGDFLCVLPIVVIAALTVSLVEAFTVLPSHMAEFVRVRPARGRVAQVVHDLRERWLMGTTARVYEFLLARCISWRYVTVSGFIALLIAAGSLVPAGVIPYVFVQDTDAETLICDLEMAAGTPVEETRHAVARIEAALAASHVPEVEQVMGTVGSAVDDEGRASFADPETVGQVTVQLTPADTRTLTSRHLVARWRRAVGAVPGARKLAFRARSGGPAGTDIEIEVRCDDLTNLRRAVDEIEDRLDHYRGVQDITDDLQPGKAEVVVELLPSARAIGLTTEGLARQLRGALFGHEAQRLQRGRDEVRVYVRLPREQRDAYGDLEQLRVSTPTGARVPLREVARLSSGRGSATIHRSDRVRAATVSADVDETIGNTAEITESLRHELAGIGERLHGVSLEFRGRRQESRDSMRTLGIGALFALLVIYGIIAVLFRSYLQPLIVMSVIPFGVIGALLGHLLLGFPFTLLSSIGLVSLSGIVVNDSLILVSTVGRLRATGRAPAEAVLEAGRLRLRPILLTSLTTIAGLSPLMLERSFQAQFLIPLAISIVFGLAFATLIVLLLVPCLYRILEDLAWASRRLWQGPGATGLAP